VLGAISSILVPVTDRIGELIERLDDQSGDGEEAKYDLIATGPSALSTLMDSIGQRTRFGKLLTIEIFDAWQDQRAAPSLITLLSDPDEAVREWSADLLGRWPHAAAGPVLIALHNRLLAESVPPHWTEPVAVRRSLTNLGLRLDVVPTLTASLATNAHGPRLWPAQRTADIVTELAQHDQVVLFIMAWRLGADGQLRRTKHETLGWKFDRSKPREANVAEALEAVLTEASTLPDDPQLFVTIEWLNTGDLATKSLV